MYLRTLGTACATRERGLKTIFSIVCAIGCVVAIALVCFAGNDPTEEHWKHGEAYAWTAQYYEALQEFDKAIASNPKFFPAYNGRAQILNVLGDFAGATDNSNKCIALNPNYAAAYANRSVSFYFLGQSKKAFDDATVCESLKDPTFPESAVYIPLAAACEGLGHIQEGLGWCDKVIALNPKSQSGYAIRAKLRIKQGHCQEAIEDCTTGIRLFPRSPRTYQTRAIAYDKLGKHDLAVADQKLAKKFLDENAEILAKYKATKH